MDDKNTVNLEQLQRDLPTLNELLRNLDYIEALALLKVYNPDLEPESPLWIKILSFFIAAGNSTGRMEECLELPIAYSTLKLLARNGVLTITTE